MIEARELSIGNLVQTKEGKLTSVTDITSEIGGFTHLDFWCYGYHSLDTEPILLTEEWLIRFGFELVDSHDDHLYYLSETDFSLDRNMQFDNSYKRVELKFVHSLQNLYFALTNKELTL